MSRSPCATHPRTPTAITRSWHGQPWARCTVTPTLTGVHTCTGSPAPAPTSCLSRLATMAPLSSGWALGVERGCVRRGGGHSKAPRCEPSHQAGHCQELGLWHRWNWGRKTREAAGKRREKAALAQWAGGLPGWAGGFGSAGKRWGIPSGIPLLPGIPPHAWHPRHSHPPHLPRSEVRQKPPTLPKGNRGPQGPGPIQKCRITEQLPGCARG